MEEEKKEREEKQEKLKEKLTEETDKQLEELLEQGINPNNIVYLREIMNLIKDKENIIYWKEKIKMYNEGNYGRGSYNDGSYGRRGVKGTGRYSRYRGGRGSGRYRGEEMLDEMKEIYGEYAEGSSYGNYGAEENMELIETMADSLMDFVEHLKKTAKSPEEKQLIQEKLQELGRM